MATLRKPTLNITPIAGHQFAIVKVTGEIEFSRADQYLMDSAFAKQVKWFMIIAQLYGKDSHEGGVDTAIYWMGSKQYPEVAATLPITSYSLIMNTVPIFVLNEDPAPGAKDEIYAKVTLTNLFADYAKTERNSDVVEITFP